MPKNKTIVRSTSELINVPDFAPTSTKLQFLLVKWTNIFGGRDEGPVRQIKAQEEFQSLWHVYAKTVRGELTLADFKKGAKEGEMIAVKVIAQFANDFTDNYERISTGLPLEDR